MTKVNKKPIHELFIDTAYSCKKKEAVVFENEVLTYEELDRLSNGFANILLETQIHDKTKRVCICVPKSQYLIIFLLGILKAGYVYVPIDVDTPVDRICYIINDSSCDFLITTPEMVGFFSEIDIKKIVIDSLNFTNFEKPIVTIDEKDAAYIIYTSGSTGSPKGVEVSHAALSNRILWQQKEYGIFHDDVILHKTSIGFDVSIWELLLGGVGGGKLAIIAQGKHKDPQKLLDYIILKKVTIIHFVPSALSVFLEVCGNSLYKTNLRMIVCSGEELTKPICDLFFLHNSKCKIELKNLYGPTEAAIDVTHFNVSKSDDIIPIGKPIDNVKMYILDNSLKQVRCGEVGEIFIGGIAVANCYVNNKNLTEQSFLTNPFVEDCSKMYKTGDLGCYIDGCNIKFLGRVDNQVKINGYRIELEEVEKIFIKNFDVVQAVAVCKNEDENKFLVMYYCPKDKNTIIDYSESKFILSKFLPFYMIPSVLTKLDNFPVTDNGKIDRKALTALDISKHHTENLEEIERQLIKIWIDILPIINSNFDTNASFFDLGGNSILAFKIISRINKNFECAISYSDFFENSSISKLIFVIAKQKQITVTNRRRLLSLTPFQKRIWVMEKIYENSSAYNYPILLEFTGNLDVNVLKKSLNVVFKKHPELRTKICQENLSVFRYFDDSLTDFNLKFIDLSNLNTEKEDTINIEIYKEINTPFLIEKEVLSRGTLIKTNDENFKLCLVFHHLIFDDWSSDLMLMDLKSAYNKFLTSDFLLELDKMSCETTNFGQFDIENEYQYKKSFNNWKTYLHKARRTNLNFTKNNTRNDDLDMCIVHKKILFCDKLRRVANHFNVTLLVLLLSSFKHIYSKNANSNDLTIGLSVSTRNLLSENSIGFYINTIPIRTIVKIDDSLDDILKKVNSNIIFALTNKDIPFEEIVKASGVQRCVEEQLFQIMFNFWEKHRDYSDFSDKVRLKQVPIYGNKSKFDLELHLIADKNDLDIIYCYKKSIFNKEDIVGFADQYECDLLNICRNFEFYITNKKIFTSHKKYEDELLNIWKNVLNIKNINTTDNFFDIGGNSFALTLVKNQIKEKLKKDVSMVALFKHYNIETLAEFLHKDSNF